MVFSSSLPLYLDPPNWPLPQDLQQGAAGPGEINSELPHLMPPPPPPLFGGGAAASVRPGSMAERARVAKVPQPETSLKCPRCESTNTKFCYFNNYSLTQPRHFCKTCRRYWTRGGALRNVPVGGGCRRNKRSKARRSKSPITNSDHQSSSTSTSAVSSNSCSTDNILGHHVQWPIPAHHQAQMSFFPHLHNLPDFGNADNIGLSSYGQLGTSGISGNGSEMEFQMGNGATTTSAGMAAGPLNLSARFSEQWRSVQPQFPFLAAGLEQFEGYGDGNANQPEAGPKTTMETAASVKQEEIHQQGPNLSRNLLDIPGNEQFWGSGNAWTDLM